MRSAAGVLRVPPLFDDQDPNEDIQPSQVRLKKRLWDRLTRIAQVETELRKKAGKKPPVISRNDVVEKALEQFCEQYERTELQPAAASPTPLPTKPKKK